MRTSDSSYGFNGKEVGNMYQKTLSKPNESNRSNILSNMTAMPLIYLPSFT